MGRWLANILRGSSQLVFALSGLFIRLEEGNLRASTKRPETSHVADGWRSQAPLVPSHATIFAERAFAVLSGQGVLPARPLQPASFLKICCEKRGYITRERRVIYERHEMAHL